MAIVERPIQERPVQTGAGITERKPLLKSIWSKVGAEITPEMQAQHPFLSAVGQTGQDVFTIPYAFFNQMALDYPRQVLEKKFGLTVPEAHAKAARGAAAVSGVTGGLKNPLLKSFGGAKAFLSKPLLKKAGISGIQAMAYPTQEGIINLKEKPGQFVTGATLGAAIPVAGKGVGMAAKQLKKIPGLPEWTARSIAGLTDFSKKTIERLGSKVFNPEYNADDFVGKVFTPKFREHVFTKIEKLTPGWKDAAKLARFKPQEIEQIGKMSKGNRTQFISMLRQGTSAQDAANLMVDDAGQVMDSIITAHNKPIVINNTVSSIKRNLLQMGWAKVDAKGNLVPSKVTNIPHSTRDNLLSLHEYWTKQGQPGTTVGTQLLPGKAKVTRAVANAQDWQYTRNRLEALYTGEPANDKVVGNVIRTLVNDAKSAVGIPGYKGAAQNYADAMLLKKIAPRVQTLTSPEKINAAFTGINAQNAGRKYQQLLEIEKSIPKDLYDDLAAHYSAKNFDPTFYPSLSGIRKAIITKGATKYYKHFPQGLPSPGTVQKLQKAGQAVKKATAPITKAAGVVGRGYMNLLEQPAFAPGRGAGAAQMLRGQGGYMRVGGGAAGRRPFPQR